MHKPNTEKGKCWHKAVKFQKTNVSMSHQLATLSSCSTTRAPFSNKIMQNCVKNDLLM